MTGTTGFPTGGRPRAVYLVDAMADVRMLEGFAAAFDVTLVAPESLGDRATNYWPPRPPARVAKVQLPGGRVGFVPRAARWLHRHRADIDVVFVLDNLSAALAANLARRGGGPPVVLQVGRPTMEYLACQRTADAAPTHRLAHYARVALARILVEYNERSADAIAAVSQYCTDQCRVRNAHAEVAHGYGVDLEQFAPAVSREEARRRLGLALDQPIVMLRSRLAPEKDPDTFLRAVAILRDEGRQFTALYMGGELDQLDALRTRHGVDIVGRKPSGVAEIPLWYIAADVNVQTSHSEGLGISPLESLACGTPVVVTDAGGLREVVDGGRVGGLVPPGDAPALAAAIARYLDDADLARAHSLAGRAWVSERFGAETAFASWAAIGRAAIDRAAIDRAARQRAGGRAATGRTQPDTRRPRRVLFVDHEARLSGGERDLVDLVRAFDPHEIEAHVALPAEGALAAALREHGAEVHIVPMGSALRAASRWELARNPFTTVGHLAEFVAVAARIARLARALRPDFVHSNSMKSHLLAIPAAWRARRPLIWHVRDILEAGWLSRVFMAVGRVVPARIIVLSEAAAASFRAAGLDAKTVVVYNGIRLRGCDPDTVDGWRHRLGAGPQNPLVGIVGQIARWKGQDTLIEAAGLLARSQPDLRFAIVGECLFPHNEGEYEAGLHRRVKELDLDDRVVFAGYADPIEPVMAALDVFVHASRLPEPFGRVIVEAMASGTPVIASTRGAGPELVPESAGCLVEPGDPPALARAIETLTAGPDRDARSAAARTAAQRFDIAITGAGVVAVYDAVSHARRHRS